MIFASPTRSWRFVLGMTLLLGAAAVAQEPSSDAVDKDKKQIEAALQLTREAARQYTVEVGETKRDAAALVGHPVLRWSNPAVGEVHGNVFLWAIRNRPAAVGSLFKWFSPHTHTSHEFQSLAEERLMARYQGRVVWITSEPGVKFTPINGAETPTASAARRLSQMRQLARRFTGHMTSRQGEEYEVRLLTQPIYRYAAPEDEVLDGGLFAFVQGTDPEILLMIEAYGGKAPSWRFAAARMQNCAVWIKLDGREAWRKEQLAWNVVFDHSQPYTLFDTPGK